MLNALTLLLVCQLTGEIITKSIGLPVPGPVLGLVFLLALLVIRRGNVARELKPTAQALLQNLSLLFVPAGVGVVDQLGVLGQNWLPVAAAIAFSTALGLATTAWLMQRLSRQ